MSSGPRGLLKKGCEDVSMAFSEHIKNTYRRGRKIDDTCFILEITYHTVARHRGPPNPLQKTLLNVLA